MAAAELYMRHGGVLLPTAVHSTQSLRYFERFAFRPEDVIIATYPKSGTTWMQELVPLILSAGDPAAVESVPNWDRAPWLEQSRAPTLNLEQRPSPRLFTTHYPHHMMPPSFTEVKPRVIYVMRNPKDVFTSSFHYYNMASFLEDPGPQSQFLRKFLDGQVMFGSWFDHVKGWLSAEKSHRVLYMSYEEMIQDLQTAVDRISRFLEKPLEPEVTQNIAERCLFKNMKKNKMSNYSVVPKEIMDPTKSEFLRKGVAGDWKNQMTAEEVESFDTVYKEKMKDVQYKFPWD